MKSPAAVIGDMCSTRAAKKKTSPSCAKISTQNSMRLRTTASIKAGEDAIAKAVTAVISKPTNIQP
jgi:hypothetical protein